MAILFKGGILAALAVLTVAPGGLVSALPAAVVRAGEFNVNSARATAVPALETDSAVPDIALSTPTSSTTTKSSRGLLLKPTTSTLKQPHITVDPVPEDTGTSTAAPSFIPSRLIPWPGYPGKRLLNHEPDLNGEEIISLEPGWHLSRRPPPTVDHESGSASESDSDSDSDGEVIWRPRQCWRNRPRPIFYHESDSDTDSEAPPKISLQTRGAPTTSTSSSVTSFTLQSNLTPLYTPPPVTIQTWQSGITTQDIIPSPPIENVQPWGPPSSLLPPSALPPACSCTPQPYSDFKECGCTGQEPHWLEGFKLVHHNGVFTQVPTSIPITATWADGTLVPVGTAEPTPSLVSSSPSSNLEPEPSSQALPESLEKDTDVDADSESNTKDKRSLVGTATKWVQAQVKNLPDIPFDKGKVFTWIGRAKSLNLIDDKGPSGWFPTKGAYEKSKKDGDGGKGKAWKNPSIAIWKDTLNSYEDLKKMIGGGGGGGGWKDPYTKRDVIDSGIESQSIVTRDVEIRPAAVPSFVPQPSLVPEPQAQPLAEQLRRESEHRREMLEINGEIESQLRELERLHQLKRERETEAAWQKEVEEGQKQLERLKDEIQRTKDRLAGYTEETSDVGIHQGYGSRPPKPQQSHPASYDDNNDDNYFSEEEQEEQEQEDEEEEPEEKEEKVIVIYESPAKKFPAKYAYVDQIGKVSRKKILGRHEVPRAVTKTYFRDDWFYKTKRYDGQTVYYYCRRDYESKDFLCHKALRHQPSVEEAKRGYDPEIWDTHSRHRRSLDAPPDKEHAKYPVDDVYVEGLGFISPESLLTCDSPEIPAALLESKRYADYPWFYILHESGNTKRDNDGQGVVYWACRAVLFGGGEVTCERVDFSWLGRYLNPYEWFEEKWEEQPQNLDDWSEDWSAKKA